MAEEEDLMVECPECHQINENFNGKCKYCGCEFEKQKVGNMDEEDLETRDMEDDAEDDSFEDSVDEKEYDFYDEDQDDY